jgi:hypothetical protein
MANVVKKHSIASELALNDIASGGKGGFYVSDSGDRAGKRRPCRYSATAGRSS